MTEALAKELAAWDGKSKQDIENVYQRYSTADNFDSDVVSLLTRSGHQRGATWLLKHYLEKGGDLSAATVRQTFKAASALDHWESRLHLLQCIPYLQIPKSSRPAAEQFIRTNLADKAKFVRAWAYSGLGELARQYPELAAETRKLMASGLKSEPASVTARIRKAMQTLG